MSEKLLCIEITGEPSFYKFLLQSGWSGKDYYFFYNRHTNSHMRAYRRLEDYLAERVDMHKTANVWPLMANILPMEKIEAHVLIGDAPVVIPAKEANSDLESEAKTTDVVNSSNDPGDNKANDPSLPSEQGADQPVKRGPGRPPKNSV